MQGNQQCKSQYGSLEDTIVTIKADESTFLFVDGAYEFDGSYNNIRNNNNIVSNNNVKDPNPKKPILKYGLSFWSFGSSYHSNDSDCSVLTTKSFKSHFREFKVVAFALTLTAALTIAIYLLVIDSRLPSVTLSLDLVDYDIWSNKIIQKPNHLQNCNVDHIILVQTGNRNCDTAGDCLMVLKEMQEQSEELPYNFLIGGDGQAYEVHGWKYQSNMRGVSQEKSLVIGIIGNYDHFAPKKILLQTAQSLIRESFKRHMVNMKYQIYGLRQNDHDRKEGEQLFKEIAKWPKFKMFIYNF